VRIHRRTKKKKNTFIHLQLKGFLAWILHNNHARYYHTQFVVFFCWEWFRPAAHSLSSSASAATEFTAAITLWWWFWVDVQRTADVWDGIPTKTTTTSVPYFDYHSLERESFQ
jgi:hypothetical protein